MARNYGSNFPARSPCDQPRQLPNDFRGRRHAVGVRSLSFEACERTDWLLHAFVVMSNHYHLAVETRVGNLVAECSG